MQSPRNSNTRIVQRSRKRKKVRKLRKPVVFLLVPLLLLFLSGLAYAGMLYTKTGKILASSFLEDGREKSSLRSKTVDPKFDNVSILIMGVDSSNIRKNSENARTDTLMVATLNKEKKSVKLLSIPRDSYVYIPQKGYSTKINHAHAFGGTKGTIDTVENLLGIPIDYYVKINFEAFIEVVDALDGVTVDVPYAFTEQDSKDKAGAIHLEPGKQKLNGEQALALARTRKSDNDIERGKRQQQIIKAIMDRSISLNSFMKYDDVIEAVGKNMTTNLTFDDMKSLISYGTHGKLDIESLNLTGRDYQPENTYFYQLDGTALSEVRHKLQRHLGVPVKDPNTQTETYNALPGDSQNSTEPGTEGTADPNSSNPYGGSDGTGVQQQETPQN